MGTWHRPSEPYDASKVHEDIKYTKEDDQAIDDWVADHVETTWHSLGTCGEFFLEMRAWFWFWLLSSLTAMKPREQGGVVDKRLNVYGTQNLKCVDLSICPVCNVTFCSPRLCWSSWSRVFRITSAPTLTRLLFSSERRVLTSLLRNLVCYLLDSRPSTRYWYFSLFLQVSRSRLLMPLFLTLPSRGVPLLLNKFVRRLLSSLGHLAVVVKDFPPIMYPSIITRFFPFSHLYYPYHFHLYP